MRNWMMWLVFPLAATWGCETGADTTSVESVGGGGSGGQGMGAGPTTTVGPGGAAPECAPVDTDFEPTWTPPQPLAQGVCTDTEIEDLMTACFSFPGAVFGNQPACDEAIAANPTCSACAITDEFLDSHGAIIDYRATLGFYDRNVHGCIAHAEGDLSANGCGAKRKAMLDCTNESCRGCLPADDIDALTKLNECATDAREGVCATYAQDFEMCAEELPGPIQDCSAAGDPVSVAIAYGQLFCGGG